MPHTLSLTQGAATRSLSTSGVLLSQFTPATPKLDKSGGYADVTESIEIAIYSTTVAGTIAIANEIERMLADAEAHQVTRVGNPVYINFQASGDATSWRALVISGRLDYNNDALQSYGQAILSARLYILRRPGWDGARVAIPLSNGNGTNVTSGLTIYNHDDAGGGNDNYVGISSTAIAGTLPAPVELRLTNTSGASRGYRDFHFANNVFDTALPHIIEGEARTNGVGTPTAVGTASNGSVLALTGAGVFTPRYTVSASVLQKTRGRNMHVLGNFSTLTRLSTGQMYASVALLDASGLKTLAASRETLLTSTDEVQVLGTLPFPPGGDATTWASLLLQVTFRMEALTYIGLDFLQLTPAEPYYYRRFKQRGMYVANNETVVDDGIEGRTYMVSAGVDYPYYISMTGALHVKPGAAQRIYLLTAGESAAGEPDAPWTFSVQAFYRPRRHVF